MPSEAFKAWLEAKPYKTATKNTYWNDLVRIEKHYGDLDEAYDQDKLSAIRTALNYTAADRRDGRANPAKFPIDGDVYRNLSAYRAKLAVYAKFREEGAAQGSWMVQADALLALKERFLARYQDFSPDFFSSVVSRYWKEEREYKEVIISRVQGLIKTREQTDEARGRALLEILQKPPANFVHFRAFMQIKAAGESAMSEIAMALGQMLTRTDGVAESFDEAAEIILPLMKSGAGSGSPTGYLRSLLSTTLALARPLDAIAVKTEFFNRVSKALIGRPIFRAAGVTSAEYQDALALAGHIFNVMRDDWKWAPKDLWDVQGFLWVTDERYREERDEEEEGDREMAQESLPSMAEPKNVILYGPPGTGKTYATAARAVELCDGSLPTGDRSQVMNRYRDLVERKRICFVTFHQSYAYEDFVEGLRPQTEGEDEEEGKASVGFSLKAHPGIFRQIAEAARENRGPARQAQPLDRSRRVFKMSLGRSAAEEGVRLFKEAIDGGYIVLGWGGDVDWSDARYDQPGSIRARWQQAHKDATPNDSNITQTYTLRVDMRVGDYVIVSDGNRRFRAIGEIVGPYQYVPNYIGTYNHRRPVRWLWYSEEGQPRELIYSKEFSQKSAYQLRPGSIDWAAIEQVVSTSGDGKEAVGTPEPYVLIIDEINRANVSRVFGELITLIEPDKRLSGSNPLTVVLPHSGDTFGVPSNLHIIGTMNTADRSIALLDTALRRRFEFEELMPDPGALARVKDLTGIDLPAVLEGLNQRIEYLFDRDHQIGHAYFITCKTQSDVEKVMRTKVIPLLAEYFYEDWEKVRTVLNEKSDEGVFVRRKRLGPPATSDQDIEQLRWRYEMRSGFAPEDYDQLRA